MESTEQLEIQQSWTLRLVAPVVEGLEMPTGGAELRSASWIVCLDVGISELDTGDTSIICLVK